MELNDFLMRFVDNMMARVSGPMKLRLFLQPTMAVIFAIRSGLKDAREGRPPFLVTVLTNPAARAYLIRDGWKSVGKVFVLAMTLDVVYQLVVSGKVYPGEVVVTAILLAIVPYTIVRGLTTRIAPKKVIPRR